MEIPNTPKRRAEPIRSRARRLDTIRLDGEDRTYFTQEGYLVDHPILTSVGIFEYRNPDGSIRRELRLPEYVFDEQSLKSYRGKPIIITHEAGRVTKDNVDREQIGTILSDGYQDGEDVRAEIIIHDTDAMKQCGLKELSLGYNLDLIEESGEWNGQHYDAIQTNIVVNHLALVAAARAGDQARLNIDGSDEPELKGGKCNMDTNKPHNDSIDLTPEELIAALKEYKGKIAGGNTEQQTGEDSSAAVKPESGGAEEKVIPNAGITPAPASDPEEKPGADMEAGTADIPGIKAVLAAAENLVSALKGLSGVATTAGKDSNADEGGKLNDPIPTAEKGNMEDNEDGACGTKKTSNADSADELIRQRLSICRIGDRLNMDGLEDKTILEAKKAVIEKVFPEMHLDGKCDSYIDAAYDLAVAEAEKKMEKGVEYQRQQISSGNQNSRADGNSKSGSMAAFARQRMIDRENGNEGGKN